MGTHVILMSDSTFKTHVRTMLDTENSMGVVARLLNVSKQHLHVLEPLQEQISQHLNGMLNDEQNALSTFCAANNVPDRICTEQYLANAAKCRAQTLPNKRLLSRVAAAADNGV